ncbi:uncharacterized protein TEOVI_000833900 [Trypanosoma equiperdum]|uniref:TPR repeat n=1 Tax=Trypanosoma equiperdum TaxID=5694 RepID=A0A1G4I8U8_TRYEQ|nr:hypothetical protein, conserved [Trypanosoma equiperdum]
MLFRSVSCKNYQRGGWSPGSKHQKHMTLNPTLYLYRFPGPHGPGPYTMKYWWTLGCFPTGMEVPFRLHEFLSTYQQEHVPVEVEEWLRCYIKDPLSDLVNASNDFFKAVEVYPEVESARGYKTLQPSIAPLLVPMKKFEEQLGVKISPVGLRSVLSNPVLKDRFLDDLFDYKSYVEKGGSTPHRRLARSRFEGSLSVLGECEKCLPEQHQVEISESLGTFIGATVSPAETTADDERSLILLLTTISEGCINAGNYSDAASVLADALMFCHDPDSQATTHANISFASLLNADFKGAEYNGREAALLQPQVKPTSTACARGYVGWAAAAAYQDDFEKAEAIVKDGLTLYVGNEHLEKLANKLQALREEQPSVYKQVPRSLRESRSHLPSQQSRGLLSGSGKGFSNEFDWVEFKNKLYPSKMDPRNNEMGSVFRRVGDLGSFISTSRSMERL